MVRSNGVSRWRGLLAAATGLLLVPAALADIVGSPAGSGTPNAGNGGLKNGSGWMVNINGQGNPASFNGAALQVTDDNGNEHNTAFYFSPQVVTTDIMSGKTGKWTASFIYQCTGKAAADGATFCIHNDPLGAMAGTPQDGGSALGYQGIDNSVAVAFNVYSQSNPNAGSGAHPGETDILYQSNAMAMTKAPGGAYANDPTMTGNPPFSITSGDPIQVTLSYDQSTTTLTQTLTDMTTGGTATYTYTIDIALLVGADARNSQGVIPGTAFVGFTGGTGGATSTQTISNFTFLENP
jgi:hypothetical protein